MMDQYLEIYTPVAELANRIDLGNKSLVTLNPTTELIAFKQMLQNLNIPLDELNKLGLDGSLGNYRLVFNGQAIDIARGVDDIKYNANILNFLRRLGLTKTAVARSKATEIKAQYAKYATGFHQIMRMKNRTKIANEIAKRYGKSPKNEQELIAILEKDNNLEEIFNVFLQKLRGSYSTNPNAKPYGDWVRKPYNARRYDLSALFTILNNHKLSLGGCWAVRADGYKCIVPSLSCDHKGGRRRLCYNDNRCGPDKQQPCYNCLKWNANNTCAKKAQCEGKTCSKSCSNREIEVPSDTVLICIKRKFWLAAQDFMNTDFTLVPGPEPPTPPTEDEDEDEDEDVDDIVPIEDDEILDDGPLRRPMAKTLSDFFKSTWLIWVIGFVIIGVIVYRKRH